MTDAPVRLLYIDDDPALCRLIQKDLARHGYDVTCVHSGDEGLAALAEAAYDIVVLDHHMPERDGLEVLPEILARPEAPPVVYVTGAQDGRLAVEALRAGAADYVIKDVHEDFTTLLKAALSDAIGRDQLKKATEAAHLEVARARDRAEAMLREVNHRVGNSLQLVSSFISLQSRTIQDPQAKEAFRATQARIEAVSQVHSRLYTSADMMRVSLDGYLGSLAEELALSLCAGADACAIRVEAAPLETTTDRAVAVGVLVAELVTNAVKYAYPATSGGEIRVRLEQVDQAQARLTVEDDGVGVPADNGAPKGSGLGRTIIAAMARDLSSEIAYVYGPVGLRATLTFSL
jgi:two-component sensor histidine kinase